MSAAAIFCFIVVLVDMVMGFIRTVQGCESSYIYFGSAILFFLLGLNKVGGL